MLLFTLDTDKWVPANLRTPSKDTKFTVAGLEKGHEYDFRVKAKNRAGLSKPSTTTGEVEVQPKPSECTMEVMFAFSRDSYVLWCYNRLTV